MMAKKKHVARRSPSLGSWAFLIGILLVLYFALFDRTNQGIQWALLVIGLIIGFFNVKGEESRSFMVSGIILILASVLGQGAIAVSVHLTRALYALLLIFVPATIIVAVRNIIILAKD
jgi:uncharacterized membrane protein YczE